VQNTKERYFLKIKRNKRRKKWHAIKLGRAVGKKRLPKADGGAAATYHIITKIKIKNGNKKKRKPRL